MRKKARQHLESQLQRLAQQQNTTKQKLRMLTRQNRLEQRSRHGEYVELAGLAHIDPETLLAVLRELATLLTDLERVARWKVQGEAWLETHRRRKAHRRRLAASGDDGTSEAVTTGSPS